MTCEGVLFTLSVGCSRLPTAVNDLATTFFFLKNLILGSTSFHSMRYWNKKKTNATFGIEKGLVQVALFQIRGGNGS